MSGESGNGEEAIREAVASAQAVEPPETDEELDLRLSKLPTNDYGNAQRLLARYGQDLMYVHGPGWFAWDGRRWAEDPSIAKGKPGMKALTIAQKTAQDIRKEVRAVRNEGWEAFPSKDDFDDYLDSLTRWARQSGNEARANSMVNMAAPYLTRHIDELDARDYLFNVGNGTLDLSGDLPVLRKHMREDRITHLADIKYDPGASRAVFNHFLDTIMPDREMQTFLQRYFGYSLTGDVKEQKLLLCFGKGGNGKSTLNNVLRKAFGSYAIGIQFESLQVDENRRGKDASPDIAQLPGRRLVFATEPEGKVKLSTATVKRFTGGEPVTTRKNFGDFFEFKYRFKLTLSFNEKPAVPAQDDGTWDRPLLVEFSQRIRDKAIRDKDMDKKLAAEASGVLNWLLDGFLEWREKGLAPPQVILDATAQYRAENDALGAFLKGCVRKFPGNTVRGGDFYEKYKKWCDKAGHRAMSLTMFGRVLPERGYKKNDTSGYVLYEDIELVSEDGPEPPKSHTSGETDYDHIDY